MQYQPTDQFLFDIIFYRKIFSKEAIEIWILIPVIPQNMLKFHAKKSLNMTEFASLKKIHTKTIIMKRNVQLNDLACLTYPDLYRLVFQTFYHSGK